MKILIWDSEMTKKLDKKNLRLEVRKIKVMGIKNL